MRVDVGFGQRLARLDDDDGHADFAPLRIGHADYGGFGNGRDLMQRVLDLGRIDVLATGDVHVLPAVDDVVETVSVDARGISRMQPAVGEGGLVGVRPVPVTGRDV